MGAVRIVALGGHEFRLKRDQLAITEHLLSLTGAERPRVCLLPTASGDPREQIADFHTVLERYGAEATHLSLFRLEHERVDLRRHLLGQDLIYVAGGSMLNLIAIWQAHGIGAIMRDAAAAGVLLAGQSAGAMCWFEHGLTASAGVPRIARGLGMIRGSLCVHYGRDPERRSRFLDAVGSGEAPAGLAIDDGAGMLFEGGAAVEAFAGTRGARVISVRRRDRVAHEEPLRPIPLIQRLPERDLALEEMRSMRRPAGIR